MQGRQQESRHPGHDERGRDAGHERRDAGPNCRRALVDDWGEAWLRDEDRRAARERGGQGDWGERCDREADDGLESGVSPSRERARHPRDERAACDWQTVEDGPPSAAAPRPARRGQDTGADDGRSAPDLSAFGPAPRHGEPPPARWPKGYTRSDARIREGICERLALAGDLELDQLEVAVDERVATLSGSVPARWMKHRAEDIAAAVGWVIDVDNRLRVARAPR
ncbi:BON domain-containing protein [Burkholderia gladioli]|uniref:BON domain-containing protein n=1 Tax=Burkholderia gladioli TaxID=28095 RepID=UPI003F79268C